MIFPPAAIPIAILLNGSTLQSYNRPYLQNGRVVAPVAPYLTRIADRIAYDGRVMVITRGSVHIRIETGVSEPRGLQNLYVPIAPLLRKLGALVAYDPGRHILEVQLRAVRDVRTMAPYSTSEPQVAPTRVFTPEPIVTPRPLYTGSPHPRRTPIVITTSRPQ